MTARRLKAEELRLICDPALLPFRSTEELAPLDTMIGQARALDATIFGIGVKHEGYNLFVLGPAATGKTSTMQRLLAQAAALSAEEFAELPESTRQGIVAALEGMEEQVEATLRRLRDRERQARAELAPAGRRRGREPGDRGPDPSSQPSLAENVARLRLMRGESR